MKNIILFTLFTLSFGHFVNAQIVEQYTDKNNSSTTVIEKVPQSDDQDILSTLNLDDYDLNEEIYIIDHRQLNEKEEKAPLIVEQTAQEINIPNTRATQIESVSPERNPIGKKVKQKRNRIPRWKSDRRGKRSSYTCFKF